MSRALLQAVGVKEKSHQIHLKPSKITETRDLSVMSDCFLQCHVMCALDVSLGLVLIPSYVCSRMMMVIFIFSRVIETAAVL